MRLEASQIANHFQLERPELDAAEIEAMYRVWADFYKTILGPQQDREEKTHPLTCCVGTDKEHPCSMFNCHHPFDHKNCKTRAEEMWQWDEYAERNYRPPQVQGRGLEQILAGVVMLFGFWK